MSHVYGLKLGKNSTPKWSNDGCRNFDKYMHDTFTNSFIITPLKQKTKISFIIN